MTYFQKLLIAVSFFGILLTRSFGQNEPYAHFNIPHNSAIVDPETMVIDEEARVGITKNNNQKVTSMEITFPDSPDVLFVEWTYHSNDEIATYTQSVNDTLFEQCTYNDKGHITEYFRLFTDTTYHWYFKYESQHVRADNLFREEVYDENMQLVAATESQVMREEYFTAKFRYTYYYLKNEKLDEVIVKNNQYQLIYRLKYFYIDGSLSHTIKYNKKGKELERTDY